MHFASVNMRMGAVTLDMLCLNTSLVLWGFIFSYHLPVIRKEEEPLEAGSPSGAGSAVLG